MIGRSIRQSVNPSGLLFQIVVGSGFALLLAIACLRFSPLLVLGTLTAALFACAALKRPEIALLGILVATSSIVYEAQLPMISVGISLHIPDVLLLGSLGVIAVRWLVEPQFKIVRTPLDWPLLVFYGVTLLSTIVALTQSSVQMEEVRRSLRVISYYLAFFVVTNLIRERRQLNFLLNGIFLMATIVAAAMVVQFLLGDSVRLVPGRVETLGTQGTLYEGVTRVLPPGWSIILISFIAILCILVMEESDPLKWLKFLQLGLLGLALLVTFLRSYWAALIIVLVLLVFLVRGANRTRLVRWGLMTISLAALTMLAISSDPDSKAIALVEASADRLGTLGRSGTFEGQDGSLNWRMIENGYAVASIVSHPVIGLGMTAKYRPWDSRLDGLDLDGSGYDFRKQIHNGHLCILLQSGLLGYFTFMWLSLLFLVRGFKHWRSIVDGRLRGIVLGFTLAYVAVLVAAVANSTFMQWRWTPVIGLIMGINEVILSKAGKDA